MDHATQLILADELLAHLEAGTTSRAESVLTNETRVYTSPALLEREKSVLFRRYPLLLGLSCQLGEPGSYLAFDGAGIPIVVIRTESGGLKAFFNACRHRGARVLAGEGCVERRITCPYHGWTYALDGRLVGIPDRGSFPGVDPHAHGLIELPAAGRDGLVWVRPVPASPLDIDAHLAGLAPELAAYGFDTYHHYEGRVLRRKMNWKMVIDTFLEPYHFGVLHPETVAPIFFPNVCLFHPFGFHLREAFPRRSIVELLDQDRADWDLIRHTALVYLLFPNTAFVVQGDHAEIWRVFPAGSRVDEAVMYLDFYVPEPVTSASARRHWDLNMDLLIRTVQEEDFPTGEGIQAGYMAGVQERVTYGRNEPALQHWQRSVAAALAESPA